MSLKDTRIELKRIFLREGMTLGEEEADAGHTDPAKNDIITVDLSKHMAKVLDHIKGLQGDTPKYTVQKNEATDEMEVVNKQSGEPDKAPRADGKPEEAANGSKTGTDGIQDGNKKSKIGKSGVDTNAVIKFISTLGKDNLKQITELPDDAKSKLKDSIITAIKNVGVTSGKETLTTPAAANQAEIDADRDRLMSQTTNESLNLLVSALNILTEDEKTLFIRNKIKSIFGEADAAPAVADPDELDASDLEDTPDTPAAAPEATTATKPTDAPVDASKSDETPSAPEAAVPAAPAAPGVEQPATPAAADDTQDRNEMVKKLQGEYNLFKDFIKKSGIDISKKPFVAQVLDVDDAKETAKIVLMIRDKERAESGKSNYNPKKGMELTIPWNSVANTVTSAKKKPGLLKRAASAVMGY